MLVDGAQLKGWAFLYFVKFIFIQLRAKLSKI
jgi:hypothetical protein